MATAEETPKCGIGHCKPTLFQGCANVNIFSVFLTLAILFSTTTNFYMMSQVTTIEKYYGFSSLQTGFIMCCNDIGFLVSTLSFSYQATRLHIPRALSISIMTFGVSGLVCSLSYFLSPMNVAEHQYVNNNSNNVDQSTFGSRQQYLQLCKAEPAEKNCTSEFGKTEESDVPSPYKTLGMFILSFGMILQGIGKGPRNPFAMVYIEDNVGKVKSPMYIGIITGICLLGPAIGFGVGAAFSKLFITLKEVPITSADPRWIGAWWLGFVMFGFISLAFGIPLMFFPRHIHSRAAKDRQNSTKLKTLPELLRALWKLLRNPMYMLLVTSLSFNIFIVSGYMGFTAKYMEVQFQIEVWKSNILMAVMIMLTAVFGTIIGGYVITEFKLSALGITKFMVIVSTAGAICAIIQLFIGCKNPDIVGYMTESADDLRTSCVENCHCSNQDYFPICGSDDRNYFSPCHAGCESTINGNFKDCSCIPQNGTATSGLCTSDCHSFVYPFAVFGVLSGFVVSLISIPSVIFSMRCVPEEEKALAIGFSTFLQTLLGWLPSPPLIGMVVDSSCIIWNMSCHEKGACVMYDIEDFRYKRFGLETVVKFIVLSMHIVLYRLAMKISWKVIHEDDSSNADMQHTITPLITNNQLKLDKGDIVKSKS